MDILVALDTLDELVHDAKAVPLTSHVRIDGARLEEAIAVIERTADAGTRDTLTPHLHELRALASSAQPVPLSGGEVRLDKTQLYAIADALRNAFLDSSAPQPQPRREEPLGLLHAIDRLDDMVHNAKPMPMTDQVRLKPERLNEAINAIRTATPPQRSEAHYILDRLDALAREAKTVPLLGQVRIDKDRLYELLDELRARSA